MSDAPAPGPGHNSGIAADRLRSLIERIEAQEEEKAVVASNVKDIYAEVKGAGFDVKIVRRVVALRKMEREAREEMQELTDLYMSSIGM